MNLQYPAVPVERLQEEFTQFHQYAFRLERLDHYDVEEERAQFEKFLSGAPAPLSPPAEDQGWLDLIREATRHGKRFERVRVLRSPVPSYVRFEAQWGYRFSAAAGEIIRVHRGDEDVRLAATSDDPFADFWLFDDARGYLLEYDASAQFQRVREIPRERVHRYASLRCYLLRTSPLADIDRDFA